LQSLFNFFLIKILIDYKAINITQLNEMGEHTLARHLHMEVIEVTENSVRMTMPVTTEVHQPMGLLHGGAVAALAENVASLAGNIVARPAGKACVGLSLQTNHLKAVRTGMVTATATAVHLGRSTQVWQVATHNEGGELINLSTMTLAVIDAK
jgi:1,4-dihydroxy-2-naphthoyl-CoA hydrolase